MKNSTFLSKNQAATLLPINHIVDSTSAKVRVFLTEIAEGVSNYKSLHSLTQQVEHQYHGRFLIELIQNAHDALIEVSPSNGVSRIAISLLDDDSEFGSLYIANDGLPFSASNFTGLSQLGQSDKDPQKSIGNKGIGFRSVLEVSSNPEIYSRSEILSKSFDGYCFGFNSKLIDDLVAPIVQLSKDSVPISPISNNPLVDWSIELIEKFRAQVSKNSIDWLIGETKFLSPYLLPIPLSKELNSHLKDFEKNGYSSVIRLPLKSETTREYVQVKLQEISSSTLLFLDKLDELIVNSSNISHRFKRHSNQYDSSSSGFKISITDSNLEKSEYISWKKTFLVEEASEKFISAVKALPGKWPEINEISLSIAIKLGDVPENGKFSIYLPTLVPTGSAANINAPFFADMSRTSIDFSDFFNAHLLDVSADLVVEIIRNQLAGKSAIEAKLIVDLLSPIGSHDTSINRWQCSINAAFDRVQSAIDEEELFLAERGWRPLNMTSILPNIPKPVVLTSERIRQNATFDIFHSELDSRVEQLKNLTANRYQTGIYPSLSQLAETLEKIAEKLNSEDGDWNGFWKDVSVLFANNTSTLREYKIILGNDGALHSASDTTIFFYPKQGTVDDSDVGDSGQALEVPINLQSHVAFLSDKIRVYEEKLPSQATNERRFLANGLVTQFRLEDIFTTVLRKHTPTLPIALNSEHNQVCNDVLFWGLSLIKNVESRGRSSETVFKYVKDLPVPCKGGWYHLRDSSFGAEWPNTNGKLLHDYLVELKTPSAKEAIKKTLVSPTNKIWRSQGLAFRSILEAGGVFNGLRLQTISPKEWRSSVLARGYDYIKLPITPPPFITESFWEAYRESVSQEVKTRYQSSSTYTVGEIKLFPGFDLFKDISNSTRETLCELILCSIEKWVNEFEKIVIIKNSGEQHRVQVDSPLKYFLKTTPWIAVNESDQTTWARPRDRWYIHAKTLGSRIRHYSHLQPLPLILARRLGQLPKLTDVLLNLGMPLYDIESQTQNPLLINTLTNSVGSELVTDSNILLGQIRDAWRIFRPPQTLSPLPQLAVRRSSKKLELISPTDELPAYLPDVATYVSELERFDFPVIAIETNDAKSLKEWFINAYGAKIQLSSELSLKPLMSGEEWRASNALNLNESELGWLIIPLLSVIAFHGPAARGVNSQAFRDRVDILKDARFDWVHNLSAGLMKDSTKIAEMSVSAIWHKESNTIIANEICRERPDELSAALAECINRDDLELPLRLAFSTLKSVEPTEEEIQNILLPLRINEEHINEVATHLKGDVGNIVKWLDILIKIINPTQDTKKLLECSTEADVINLVNEFDFDKVILTESLNAAKTATDMFEFGRSMNRLIGNPVTLPNWNKVLDSYQIPHIKNRNSSIQIQTLIEEVSSSVKKVIVHLLKAGTSSLSFVEMNQQFRAISNIDNLEEKYWEINFHEIMELLSQLAKNWGAEEALTQAIIKSENLNRFHDNIQTLGVDLNIDADDINRINHQLTLSLANQIEQIRLAWELKNLPIEAQADWKNEASNYIKNIQKNIEREGFINLWNESTVLKLFQKTDIFFSNSLFWNMARQAMSIQNLVALLELDEQAINNAQDKLSQVRNQINLKKKLISICGQEFDTSEENLSLLWDHIESNLSNEDLLSLNSLDVSKNLDLKSIKKRNRQKEKINSGNQNKKLRRQTKEMDELIGLAGEIFVYRMLNLQYGSDVISPSSWVSENSKYRFPLNEANDSRGFDITFTHEKILYRVEVKATAGDDESFNLGSTEIKVAMELASTRKKQKEKFVLIHVKKALSINPEFSVLPNPYDPKYQGLFIIEEADARVRYHAI